MKRIWRSITLVYRCADRGGELALKMITHLLSEQDIWDAFANAADALNGSLLRKYSKSRYRRMTLLDACVLFDRAMTQVDFREQLEVAGICVQRIEEITQQPAFLLARPQRAGNRSSGYGRF